MKESQSNYALIMAGGVGSRFWPTSTASFPKQFQDLTGCGRTLLQQTVDRLEGILPLENIYILTNADYLSLVSVQLPSSIKNKSFVSLLFEIQPPVFSMQH